MHFVLDFCTVCTYQTIKGSWCRDLGQAEVCRGWAKREKKKGCSNHSAVLLQALESRLPAVCETNHDVIPGLVKKKNLDNSAG